MVKNKEQLITEFEQMKSMEESANSFYLQVASDTNVTNEDVKRVMAGIAGDEARHVKMVEKIINIIKNNL